MALVTSCWLCDILLAIVAIVGAAYLYVQEKFKYWKKKHVLQTTPKFPVGDITGFLAKRSMIFVFDDIYKKSRHEKFFGFYAFHQPALMVNDIELIKNILVKDFQHFHDRGIEMDTKLDPLAGHLFAMTGQEWRNLRVRLTPTFTSGKMKMMFPILTQVAVKLNDILEKTTGQDVDMKDMFSRYSLDVISSCAFGLETSSLENPDSEFRKMTRRLNDKTFKQMLYLVLMMLHRKIPEILRLKFMPQNVNDFFLGIVRDTIEYRQKNNVERKDFMQLLIQLMKQGYVEDPDVSKRADGEKNEFSFDVGSAAAQAFLFLLAALETSSSTMDFATYELCKNQEIQKKLQKEIDSVMAKHEGRLTFEGIQEMHYLDMVVSEILRMYPITGSVFRICTKDYTLPDTGVTIEKGIPVLINALGIHRDSRYYPHPETFDPERFTPQAVAERNPYTYIPFGEGPRMCIGNRFGLMQVKVGLASVLSNFNVVACDKTPTTLLFDETKDLLAAKGGLPVMLEKRLK